jgi:putative membrane protein
MAGGAKESMMRSILALMFMLMAGPAIAQSVSERAAGALGMTPATEDFVKTVAIRDMFEVESSKLAQQKASGNVKAFANHMVSEHTKTTAQLKGLVQSGKVKAQLPNAMDSAHQSKVDQLKGLNGEDFNKTYRDMQISAHKDAVSLFERYAKGGDSKALKAWASKTLPSLKHHLKMAESGKR